MVTLNLTLTQARLLSTHINADNTLLDTSKDTIPFTIDPVLIESLRYTAIMRASPILQMNDLDTWKELVYVLSHAMVEHKLGLPAHAIA